MDANYLLGGGGMRGDAAVKGIGEQDAEGWIVVVGSEPHPPYKRPPLTKGLWSGGDEATIWKHTADAGADVILGRTIVALDLEARRATDDAGNEYGYDKLLLATGGTPRRLGGADAKVIYYRTLDDFRKLKRITDGGAHVIVIGGGFIGSQLAASLASAGARGGTWGTTRTSSWAASPGSSRRITGTRRAGSWARTWLARTSRTTTCRSSTPTSSTSATRPSASSTRGLQRSRPGRSRTARE